MYSGLQGLMDDREGKWLGFFDRLAHSYLAWAMVAVVVAFWGYNVRELFVEHQAREERFLQRHQERLLDQKRDRLEDVFRVLYQHVRMVSLIPAVRGVSGANRSGEHESAVRDGRISLDAEETIQQIYFNISRNVRVSELYYILDGFRPAAGEVPLLAYDSRIRDVNAERSDGDPDDVPPEDETAEYAYYTEQLRWFRSNFPRWQFDNDLDEIPALMSPLLHTCDNTQYPSIAHGDVRNTYGLLYSVPVYRPHGGDFVGLVSAVLRANVLEAILIGVPQLVITEHDRATAAIESWSMPPEPSPFVLTHDQYGFEIFDRRHPDVRHGAAPRAALPGRWASVEVHGQTDGTLRLHHYLPPAQIDALLQPIRAERNGAIFARILLLVALMLVFWRAIRDQRRHHAELVRLALFDPLTALPNRRLFVRRLDQSLARAKRNGKRVGLMALDIDNFGIINDTLGHQTGDAMLAAVAARLREILRICDEVGLRGPREGEPSLSRLGGDDFTLVLEDLERPEDAATIAERIMEAFREPLLLAGHSVELSLSAGLTVFPDDADHSAELMICADQALRHANDAGNGQYRMFNDEMRRRAERQNRLAHDVSTAVRERQFSLVYQPKLDLHTGEVVSFEALLRWKHAELGFVSPAEFVPLLERNGQIVDVGRWIFETACAQLRVWQSHGHPQLRMNVNVSVRQLLLTDVVGTIRAVLERTGVPAEALTVEITESVVIDNLQEGQTILERLRALGVRIAIDDFGTGYSSLTYLQRLPVDCLKLDKSMIDTVLEPRGAHVVRSTIGIAHGLGLEVVAEGVEHESQKAALAAMDCDVMQGYLLSRPLSAEAAGEFLQRQTAAALAD